jgi:hypothetical protein
MDGNFRLPRRKEAGVVSSGMKPNEDFIPKYFINEDNVQRELVKGSAAKMKPSVCY